MLALPTKSSRDSAQSHTNRFLFIASDYKPWPGGIAEYIDALVRGLISLGDTTKLLGVVQPNEKDRIEFLETYEPWVLPFPLTEDTKPANSFGRKCVSLLEILRCLNPHCHHLLDKTPFFRASADAIARLDRILSIEIPTLVVFGHLDIKLYPLALSLVERRQPYVVIAHDSEIRLPQDDKKNDLILRRMMLKGASWIAANSRHTKSLVEMWGLLPERVKVIPCCMSDEAISESTVLTSTSKNDGDLRLVTVCRLVKGKGIDIVLRALSVLSERGIPFQYVIGGEGPERGSLEALVDQLGLKAKVRFQGSVAGPAKWSLFRNADLFVMPSRFDPTVPWREGFGIAFVEAAAFGVPAVASRSGGIPDAVLDGETGILVPEEAPADLVDALTFLYRNPETRIKMGGVARERARREFSPQAVAARFKETLLSEESFTDPNA